MDIDQGLPRLPSDSASPSFFPPWVSRTTIPEQGLGDHTDWATDKVEIDDTRCGLDRSTFGCLFQVHACKYAGTLAIVWCIGDFPIPGLRVAAV